MHVTEPIPAVSRRILIGLIGDDREDAREPLVMLFAAGRPRDRNAHDGAAVIEADLLVELLASLPVSHASSQQHATCIARHVSFGDPTFEEIESACKFFCARIKKYLISSRSFYTVRVAARAGGRRASSRVRKCEAASLVMIGASSKGEAPDVADEDAAQDRGRERGGSQSGRCRAWLPVSVRKHVRGQAGEAPF
ncbi:MAG TPA: hypothetical protein VGJ78_21905 [Vicinamibacterales bacterium]